MVSLSDLLGGWVRRNYPKDWRDGLTWTLKESHGDAYHYSTYTQSDGCYDAIILGEDQSHTTRELPVVDKDALLDGSWSLQAFLADLFQVGA